MTKRNFNISVNWGNEKKSIYKASVDLWKLLTTLSGVDEFFSSPIFSKENQQDVTIKIDELSEDEAVSLISSTILNFCKSDILKYEGETEPTIDYSRDFGFSFVLVFKGSDIKKISFVTRIGSSDSNGINMLSFDGNEAGFEWWYNLLKALISGSDALRGVIGVRDISFQKKCKDITAPLGWVSYFSNSYNLSIPNDLEGLEYKRTDKGKYLILTREDFTMDEVKFEANKQKLLDIMDDIKKMVPEYSK